MTLQAELRNLSEAIARSAPRQVLDALARADVEIAGNGVARRAARAGDRAPGFILAGADGQTVCLSRLLAQGPVVLSFYRGDWCPFCGLELQALREALPGIRELGANVVAIAAEAPADGQKSAGPATPGLVLLSDPGCMVARSYGVAYQPPVELRPILEGFGYRAPLADDGWWLPLPATYVIAPDGVIALAFVDTDFRNRLDPEDVIAALACMRARFPEAPE